MNATDSLTTPPFFYKSSSTDTTSVTTQTIGRFAPSPTGALHFGSLIAATASYLCARTQQGQWVLRIEDVDTQRCTKEASISIIKTLESYGFEWDGEIIYQSQRNEAYQEALNAIKQWTYPCSCTRKQLIEKSASGKFGYIYSGTCRNGAINPDNDLSIRVKTNNDKICFKDQCQKEVFHQKGAFSQKGAFCQRINQDIGDFILKRRDGLFAYQLAVVVDDAWQGVNQVVRGADLFDNTPRQIYLQKILGYTQPDYLHFPVAVDKSGKKLSKQNLSPEISAFDKRANLIKALDFLGQKPPNLKHFSSLNDLWLWAINNWDASKISKNLTQIIQPLND